jgi:hypothetical protein
LYGGQPRRTAFIRFALVPGSSFGSGAHALIVSSNAV